MHVDMEGLQIIHWHNNYLPLKVREETVICATKCRNWKKSS